MFLVTAKMKIDLHFGCNPAQTESDAKKAHIFSSLLLPAYGAHRVLLCLSVHIVGGGGSPVARSSSEGWGCGGGGWVGP